MPKDYAERRQERIDRYQNRSESARSNSDGLLKEARTMASAIPFGQPILVGHHSEQRDRNYRSRIQNKYGKAFGEGKRADYWDSKAAAAENNRAISSDDPEAVKKLAEKVAAAEKLQEMMKTANRIVRKKKLSDDEKVALLCKEIKVSEADAGGLLTPDFAGRVGFPSYALQNNNANIRRMKQRLDQLKAAAAAEHKETVYNGFKVVENPEENRVQFFFDEKPSAETRAILKGDGFKFSKRNGNAWQRFLSPRNIWIAESAAKEITALLD